MVFKTAIADRLGRLVYPVCAVAGLLVTACESVNFDSQSQAAKQAEPAKEARATESSPPELAANPPESNSASTEKRAMTPDVATLPPPPEPAVNNDPKRLLGLDQGGLSDLLGTPAFMRRDAPAQLWRYRGETCRIDLFLYREGKTDPARYVVRHYAVLSDIDPPPSAGDCLKGMLLARLSKQAG